jgi:tripartite-type tricarboxylate transporter receptor subunit TctC
MQLSKTIMTAAVLAVSSITTVGALAQAAWPSKPIALVIPFAAGGPTDVVGRVIAASMTKATGSPVIVENKVGAGGTVAAAYVKNAKPDGYTFFLHHNGMATAPALYRKLSYNPLTDFEYISQVVDVPMTVVARKDFPAKDVKELIAYVKANNTKINLGHAGLGAVSQLCGMMLQKALGVNMTTVPFGGTGPAMNALVGGQIDLMCDQTTNTLGQAEAGAVKMYAVTTSKRISALPKTPTLAESGLPGFEVVVWHGVYAPKGTPKEITAKFNGMIKNALKDPEVIKNMTKLGAVQVADSKLSPAGLQSWLSSELDKYVPMIRAAGQYAD